MKDTFNEAYEIKYHCKRDDGYWDYGCIETVTVPVKHGVNEKCNHDLALRKFLEMNPNAIVENVCHC